MKHILRLVVNHTKITYKTGRDQHLTLHLDLMIQIQLIAQNHNLRSERRRIGRVASGHVPDGQRYLFYLSKKTLPNSLVTVW